MLLEGFEIDPQKIPNHVGIIMDGNGRWARARGKKRVEGHRAGLETLKRIIEFNCKLKIPVVSVYAFSTENWSRPKDEVNFLMSLGKDFIKNYTEELHRNQVHLTITGTFEKLNPDLIRVIQESVAKTRNNQGFTFNIAFNYGGRREILDAVLKLSEDLQNKQISKKSLSEESFRQYLYHPDLPDVDLLIRTSGEMRISNFLLWQIAYSEIKIFDKYWPDFTPKDLCEAVENYQNRERRFGNV